GESASAKLLVHASAGRQPERTTSARVLPTLAGARKKEKARADGRGTKAAARHLWHVPFGTSLRRSAELRLARVCALPHCGPCPKQDLKSKRESTKARERQEGGASPAPTKARRRRKAAPTRIRRFVWQRGLCLRGFGLCRLGDERS